jgi:Zn-dependent metalloprotease
MVFLTENQSTLKIDPDHLRFVRATEVHGRWYVSFRQTHEGLDVLFSEIELRVFENGNVMAFGVDFFPDINVTTSPSLPLESVTGMATAGLTGVAEVTGSPQVSVLPVVREEGIAYHLVYEVTILTDEPPGNYITLVDAHTGELLWRHNRVRYTDVAGRSTGMIQWVIPTGPFVEEGFSSQYVTIGGVQVTTDSLGYYSRDITAASTLTTTLYGPYVNVNRQDAGDASFATTVNPGDTLNILWNDSNSHPAERDGFFHTTFIHDFITTLDPNFTAINYSMPCAVNIADACNAFWNGNGINFYLEGGGCPNTAQMPGVVYHEYGHGINDRLYQQLGQGFGMINGATHEGMADVAASVIEDDSRIGQGFFGAGTVLRNLDNSLRYPQNVSGDPHITGLIIGGAFWDLREMTDLETYQYLTHFAKYGLPDDSDDGTAFSEWFIETLVADDDDGNLANGTPHMLQIVAAFNLHGIGSELFYRNSFSHTPLGSTTDTLNAYVASFTLDGVPVAGGEPDSVQIVYSVDDFQTSIAVDAVITGTNQYEAEIPAQSLGTLVNYYISAYDFLSGGRFNFPSTAPSDSSYKFLVGGQEATPGLMYAASTGNPYGNLYTMDIGTGEVTLIGSLGTKEVHGMSIRPSTGEIYGVSTGTTNSTLHRVSPLFGDAVADLTLSIPGVRAIAFGDQDTLYGVTATGGFYRIDVTTGATTLIGTTVGNLYWALALDPATENLYAAVRFVDRVYTINRLSGSATLVGETGFNTTTMSLSFSESGSMYGMTGTNQFIRIDTGTGEGTLVGSPSASGIISLAMRVDSVILSVGPVQESGLPEEFTLGQNYPNPFNPETVLTYALPEASHVRLTIYNMLGQQVRSLVDESQAAGFYHARWDGTGEDGRSLASGVYVARMDAEGRRHGRFSMERKMLFIK